MNRLRRAIDGAADRLRAALEGRAARQFSEAPLCAAPLAPPAEYRRIWAEAQSQVADDII